MDDAALKAKIDDVSKLRFGSNIGDIDKARLISVLVKYHDVFQWHDDLPGRTNVVEHRIDTLHSRPVVQKQYPIPSVAKNALVEQVRDIYA